jgi:hypothetical protein
MLAIWMTGSTCASGKMPFRPAHSISKLSMRRGANFCQLSSGGCEMKASHLMQNIVRHLYTRQTGVILPNFKLYLTCGFLVFLGHKFVLTSRNLNPIHTYNLQKCYFRVLTTRGPYLGIDHETQGVRNVTLER